MGNTFRLCDNGKAGGANALEGSVVEERLRFVARLLDGEAMTDLCREFGISRKTGNLTRPYARLSLRLGLGMETFTLVVLLWLSDVPFRENIREARTPGLGEDECKAAAKLVAWPQGRAWCEIEGRPAPAAMASPALYRGRRISAPSPSQKPTG